MYLYQLHYHPHNDSHYSTCLLTVCFGYGICILSSSFPSDSWRRKGRWGGWFILPYDRRALLQLWVWRILQGQIQLSILLERIWVGWHCYTKLCAVRHMVPRWNQSQATLTAVVYLCIKRWHNSFSNFIRIWNNEISK